MKRREQYEERVRQRCDESGEQLNVVLVAVKTSIDPKLLEVLCLYELQKAVDDVTSNELLTLINSRVNNVKNAQIPDLDEFFKQRLKVDMHEDDIDARVLKYFRDFSTLIEQNGLTKVLGIGDPSEPTYQERMKLRCAILLDNLEPSILRNDVVRHVKYENRDARKNDFVLFGIIKERARAQHKYHMLQQEQRARAIPAKRDKSAPATSKNADVASGSKKREPSPYIKAKSGSGGPIAQKEKKNAPPRTGCWHCKGDHWLRDCPSASVKEKTAAQEKMKEFKARHSGQVKKIATAPASGEVLVNEVITIPYCADSGSNATYVPRQYVDELISLGCCAKVVAMPKPEKVTVAGGAQVMCRDSIKLDLLLQTVAGQVRLSDVSCIILEGNEAEFILGNDMLVTLGIDVNAQLSQLAAVPAVRDNDPFEPAESDDVPVLEMRQHLEKLVDDAAANGFDSTLVPVLRKLCLEFEDIFRIQLKNEPPANVEPQRVTVQDGSTPYRTRQRRYSPTQQEFMTQRVQELLDAGHIKRATHSRWASAVLVVPKPNQPGKWRLVVDLRPINSVTVRIAGTAPDLTTAAQYVKGSYGVAIFDLPDGF